MNSTININSINYRPCYVNGEKALFHKWEDFAKPIPPSMLLGGDPGGQVWHTLGIVEMEDGCIKEVPPRTIRFADNLIKEYAFDNEIKK